MSELRTAVTVIFVLCLAVGSGYALTNIVYDSPTPQVYSFNVEDKQVNDLEIYYTIPAESNCSKNFDSNGMPKVNIGTFNPSEDVVLLKTYPGERLKFCNPDGYNTSDTFQIQEDFGGEIVVKPDWIEVGTGKIQLTHRSMDDEEMKNVTES